MHTRPTDDPRRTCFLRTAQTTVQGCCLQMRPRGGRRGGERGLPPVDEARGTAADAVASVDVAAPTTVGACRCVLGCGGGGEADHARWGRDQ